MTMKQLTNSMDMMRQACAPKYKVEEAELHALRKSMFPADPHKELKCYTMCIAQMAGTVNDKKGEISFSKTMAQIEAMLPPDIKPKAKEALTHCKDVRNKLLSGIKQHRMVTRTRGIVLRIFEAICNCTNSAPIPGQRPATAPANLGCSSKN
ncbi:hypothetical protein ZHAS_00015263 [Anopheles sinensis]|uniref:Uncharacterized protein n=1 Tax=Anopheles sinensis TaxID=74873 RepID=A0A084WAI8_ANOSI|nr:hypothetical protein ZHAS_00015263 [Anopheles sinensis]